MTEPVHFDESQGVATLTMDDGKANAFGPPMISALSAALDRAAAQARAVVIAGRAGVLCAGFDLRIIRGDDVAASNAMREAGRALLLRVYLHPQPVVFACTGHALAAGALLLLTGDVRVGARGEFKIGLNETSIGLSLPQAGLELARDRLDMRHLSAATLSATVYDPAGALEAGYLDELSDPDEVVERAQACAAGMTELDAQAFALTKSRLRQPTIERIRAAPT